MREWNGRYRDDQRGACLEAPLKGKSVVGDVVDHRGISSGIGVCRREDGEEIVNRHKNNHNKTISGAIGVRTRC